MYGILNFHLLEYIYYSIRKQIKLSLLFIDIKSNVGKYLPTHVKKSDKRIKMLSQENDDNLTIPAKCKMCTFERRWCE